LDAGGRGSAALNEQDSYPNKAKKKKRGEVQEDGPVVEAPKKPRNRKSNREH